MGPGSLSPARTRCLLLLILAVAAALRGWGISFGLPAQYRPDEEYLVSRAIGFHGGDLNPRLFLYPTLYPYFLSLVYGGFRLAGGALGLFGPGGFHEWLAATGASPMHELGRLVTAAIGVAGVHATWRLGRLVLGASGGLLAAALLAVNFIHVRDSHFVTTDVPMTFLATIALAAAVRLLRRGRARDYAMAGLWSGLAASAKYTAVALAVPLLLAHAAQLWRTRTRPWDRRALGRAAAAAAVAAAAFACTSPYVLLDHAGRSEDLGAVRGFATHGLGGLDDAHGARWVLDLYLRHGMGTGPLLLAAAGAAAALSLRRRPASCELLVLASFAGVLCVLYGAARWAPVRYAVLLMPVLVVLAAHGALVLARRGLAARWQGMGAAALVALAGIDPASRSLALDRLLVQADTRSLARAWIRSHVPPGETLAVLTDFYYGKPPLADGRRYLPPAPGEAWPADARWAVTDEHPIYFSWPPRDASLVATLEARGERELCFSPWRRPDSRERAVFDVSDAFYVPLAGFEAVERPGPEVCVWRLAASGAADP